METCGDAEVQRQRQYYRKTAEEYNTSHVHEKDEHFFALSLLIGALDFLEVESILDVGSGTGRVLSHLKEKRPGLRVVGIEPVEELREVGYKAGIDRHMLIDGDATKQRFADGEFDLVCEFGVLHHIKRPELAVAEMLRVARKAIFISDSNNFGQGSLTSRTFKQFLDIFGLWRAADFVKTRGRGYTMSEGDGLAYSYSVFSNHRQIRDQCQSVNVVNLVGSGWNPYRTAGHVALLGIKKVP